MNTIISTKVMAAVAVVSWGALASPRPAPADHSPLYTHSDRGPISVELVDAEDPVKLEDAHRDVQSLATAANALIAEGKRADAERIDRTLDRQRTLRQELDPGPADYLYLAEVRRRLERMRLARLPVAGTRVAAAYAARYPDRFDNPVLLRREADDLGISYGALAACLELADFPNEQGPREVVIDPGGAMRTLVAGTTLSLDIVPFRDNRMLVRGVTVGDFESPGFRARARLTRYLLERCI